MANIPLHVDVGHNSVEVVKFLLNLTGPETVELEAKNMYGETSLYMAAKNGCNESASLLLANGASTEAKANNGMTPLHLSVWHSLRAEDSSTVKTLLEHNADPPLRPDLKHHQQLTTTGMKISLPNSHATMTLDELQSKPYEAILSQQESNRASKGMLNKIKRENVFQNKPTFVIG